MSEISKYIIERKPFRNLNKTVSMLLIHIQVTIFTEDLFGPYRKLFKHTKDFKNSYLPAMPHDDDFEVFKDFKNIKPIQMKYKGGNITEDLGKLKAYQCRNGHVYTIGECTKAMEKSICPTCKAEIGGEQHRNVDAGGAGYAVNELKEKEDHAYCVHEASKRGNNPESIRNMGLLNTTILRLILDSVLYLSSTENPRDTAELLTVVENCHDTAEFFLLQINKDIRVLANVLQHSPDESLLLVHFLLSQAKLYQTNRSSNLFATIIQALGISCLNTKEKRNNYEQMLCQDLLNRVINNNQDGIIKNMIKVITDDMQNSASDQLSRIAYDLIEVPESGHFLDDKRFWFYRKQITVEAMIKSFQSMPEETKKVKQLKILNEFFEKIYRLEALRYLPNINRMLNLLINVFNRQINKDYARSLKINKMLENNTFKNKEDKEIIETGCRSLLAAWHIMKPYSEQHTETNHLNDYESLSLSHVLPSSFKDGRFINALFVDLVNLQNEFIGFYNGNIADITNTMPDDLKSEKVDFEALTSQNCISFSLEKDILNLTFACSNYSLESNKDIVLEYDFVKLQTAIVSRYLTDKRYIEPKVGRFFLTDF